MNVFEKFESELELLKVFAHSMGYAINRFYYINDQVRLNVSIGENKGCISLGIDGYVDFSYKEIKKSFKGVGK